RTPGRRRARAPRSPGSRAPRRFRDGAALRPRAPRRRASRRCPGLPAARARASSGHAPSKRPRSFEFREPDLAHSAEPEPPLADIPAADAFAWLQHDRCSALRASREGRGLQALWRSLTDPYGYLLSRRTAADPTAAKRHAG